MRSPLPIRGLFLPLHRPFSSAELPAGGREGGRGGGRGGGGAAAAIAQCGPGASILRSACRRVLGRGVAVHRGRIRQTFFRRERPGALFLCGRERPACHLFPPFPPLPEGSVEPVNEEKGGERTKVELETASLWIESCCISFVWWSVGCFLNLLLKCADVTVSPSGARLCAAPPSPIKTGHEAQILAYHTHCIHIFSPLLSPGLVLSESVDDRLPAPLALFRFVGEGQGQLRDARVTFLSLLWHRSHPDSVCMQQT